MTDFGGTPELVVVLKVRSASVAMDKNRISKIARHAKVARRDLEED